MSKEVNMWATNCSLTTSDGKESNCSIRIGVYYKHCSLHSLKDDMWSSRTQCSKRGIPRCCIKWIDQNKELIKTLKNNEKFNVQITAEDFSDMNFPPYVLIKNDYQLFLRSYAKITSTYGFNPTSDSDDNGDDEKKELNKMTYNFQIYYDTDCDILYYANADSFYFGGENITAQVQIMFRYIFLKDILLKQQDSEFNIYRSYYFDPRHDKMAMALLATILQVVLTVAITIDVGLSFDDVTHQDNYLIIASSILAFCFISYSTNGTAKLFRKFYHDINLAYDLPWFLVFCDYFSNVIIAMYICLLSLFFLLQSPSYTELVLNAFALTFLVEIDDMINIFDSDEEVVIIQDLRSFIKTNCQTPRKVDYTILSFIEVLLSPLKVLETVWIFFQQFWKLFVVRHHKKKRR